MTAMLLDLQIDPLELKNPAEDPKYKPVVDKVRRLLSRMPKGN